MAEGQPGQPGQAKVWCMIVTAPKMDWGTMKSSGHNAGHLADASDAPLRNGPNKVNGRGRVVVAVVLPPCPLPIHLPRASGLMHMPAPSGALVPLSRCYCPNTPRNKRKEPCNEPALEHTEHGSHKKVPKSQTWRQLAQLLASLPSCDPGFSHRSGCHSARLALDLCLSPQLPSIHQSRRLSLH